MPATYLGLAPELYGPALALVALGAAARPLRALIAAGAALLAVAAWLFRAPRAPGADAPDAPPPLALVAPASGAIARLDCLRPFGHGRVVVAPRDPFRDASVVVAPLDGAIAALPAEPDDAPGARRFALDTAAGRLTLTVAPRAAAQRSRVGRALARVVPLAGGAPGDAPRAIARGAPIAFATYGADAVTLEYPLTNAQIQKELGARLAVGAPDARGALGVVSADWAGPDR